jgi:hypothetical protein
MKCNGLTISVSLKAKLEMGIKEEVISHWHPNVTINVVSDFTNWTPGQVLTKAKTFFKFQK